MDTTCLEPDNPYSIKAPKDFKPTNNLLRSKNVYTSLIYCTIPVESEDSPQLIHKQYTR